MWHISLCLHLHVYVGHLVVRDASTLSCHIWHETLFWVGRNSESFGCSRNIHGGITSAVAIIQLVSLSKCTCVVVLTLISGAQSWRHWRRKFDNYYNYWLAVSTTYLSGHLAIRVVCCALSYSVDVFVCLVLCLYCPVKHAECCMSSLCWLVAYKSTRGC